jgi:hypothetical protein
MKSTSSRWTPRRILFLFIKIILAAVVIYFAGRQLVNNWSSIKQFDWTINPYLLVLSVAMHLFTFLILSSTWCMLMKAFGHDIPLRYGYKVSYIANLGRYIPGKIWPVFGMVYLLNRIKVSKETALASWGIATLLGLPPAFLAGFIAISFYPQMLSERLGFNLGVGPEVIVALIIVGSVITAFIPHRLLKLFNWILKLVRRPAVTFELNKAIILKVYGGYFVGWVSYGAAFYVFMRSIMPNPPVPVVAGIGAFVAAYIIGWMALFAPGGIGAREWVLTTVLTPFLGPVAAGVAITARLWNLCSEVIAALIALLIKMEGKRD